MEAPTILRHLRLTTEQYMHDVVPKTQIVLHHTVGGSVKSTFDYWQQSADRVATAFLIDRNGDTYEVFDPHFWAFHLGLTTANNRRANMQSIGIELASEGALRSGAELNTLRTIHGCTAPFDPQWLYAFDIDADPKNRPPSKWFSNARKLYPMTDIAKFIALSTPYRGYSYFDQYDEQQVTALVQLVRQLCEDFHIPMAVPEFDMFAYQPKVVDFKGIVHHAQVRQDKSDLHPGFNFSAFLQRLTEVSA
jgi:hypothetical protein